MQPVSWGISASQPPPSSSDNFFALSHDSAAETPILAFNWLRIASASSPTKIHGVNGKEITITDWKQVEFPVNEKIDVTGRKPKNIHIKLPSDSLGVESVPGYLKQVSLFFGFLQV